MFSLLFCAELGSSAARSSESVLAPSAKLLCSFPSMLLAFYFCSKCKYRALFFPCNCGLSLRVSQVEEPSHSHEEILSLSSLYTFNVWQALFSVAAEFLPCTALFVPPGCWPFSAQGLSLTWHGALVLYCSVH